MRPGLVFYVVLTFAISRGGLVAIGGLHGKSGDTWQSDPILPLMVAAMRAGPSVAGMLMTTMASRRARLRVLLSRLLRWRVGVRWYVVALLIAPCVFIVVHLVLSLASPAFLPRVITVSDRAPLVLSSIAGALAVGFFEEISWTAFATRSVRRRRGVLATGLMVGMPWGAWHLLTNDFRIASKYSSDLPSPDRSVP